MLAVMQIEVRAVATEVDTWICTAQVVNLHEPLQTLERLDYVGTLDDVVKSITIWLDTFRAKQPYAE